MTRLGSLFLPDRELRNSASARTTLADPEHPDVNRRDRNVGSQLLQSFGYQIGATRLDAAHPCCGLNGHRSNAGHSVAAVRGDGLDVGGYSGARGWVKARYGQYDRRSLSHGPQHRNLRD